MEREEKLCTEIINCTCGRSSVVFVSGSEDNLYLVEINNVIQHIRDNVYEYFCKSCREKLTEADKDTIVYV